MEGQTVVNMVEYKAQQDRSRALGTACQLQGLPDDSNLWELLDRNISVMVWKENS